MIGAQFIFLEDWAKRGAIAAIERSHRIKKVSEAPPRVGRNGGEEASKRRRGRVSLLPPLGAPPKDTFVRASPSD